MRPAWTAALLAPLLGCGGSAPPLPFPVGATPYVGVSCARPGATACDTVGVAVWTRRLTPGLRVELAGHVLRPGLRNVHDPRGRFYEGRLHAPGLLRRGPLRRGQTVRLVLRAPGFAPRLLEVPLRAGYG